MTRLGIIGAGIMGERLLRAAQGEDSVCVVGLWDPDAGALDRLAGLGARACRSADEVIAAADCVYVASPPATHLGHARAALAAGKALFCEKPLAVDVTDAVNFLREAAGLRAAVNFPFASSPAVERVAGWAAEGRTESVSIEVAFARWPRGWQHAAAGWLDGPAQGGFTREVVSHFLFLARRLFGPLALNAAMASFPDAGRSERTVTATLTAGGVPVSLRGEVGAVEDDDRNSFTIAGSAGSVRLRNWGLAERLDGDAWKGDPDALDHATARPLVLKLQMEGVALMTQGKDHRLATLQEAFEVQSMVEAILAS